MFNSSMLIIVCFVGRKTCTSHAVQLLQYQTGACLKHKPVMQLQIFQGRQPGIQSFSNVSWHWDWLQILFFQQSLPVLLYHVWGMTLYADSETNVHNENINFQKCMFSCYNLTCIFFSCIPLCPKLVTVMFFYWHEQDITLK